MKLDEMVTGFLVIITAMAIDHVRVKREMTKDQMLALVKARTVAHARSQVISMGPPLALQCCDELIGHLSDFQACVYEFVYHLHAVRYAKTGENRLFHACEIMPHMPSLRRMDSRAPVLVNEMSEFFPEVKNYWRTYVSYCFEISACTSRYQWGEAASLVEDLDATYQNLLTQLDEIRKVASEAAPGEPRR